MQRRPPLAKEPIRSDPERAIAINPNDAGALAGRGNILMWLGQTDAAIEALADMARELKPSYPGALW
jgi:Flp pilus assembly protein TadD